MDYEKAYKGARERCRWQLANKLISEECATDLFRDIKESEDEKIRKAIVKHFKAHSKKENIVTYNGVATEDIIAYLERQKEHKLPEPEYGGENKQYPTEYRLDQDTRKKLIALVEKFGQEEDKEEMLDYLETYQPVQSATEVKEYNFQPGDPDEKAIKRLKAMIYFAFDETSEVPMDEACALDDWLDDKCKPAEWNECKIPKDIEKDAVQFCFDKGLNVTPYQAKQIASHYLRIGHNEGYIEGRKNAHIPAKDLGLPSSMDYKHEWGKEDEEKLSAVISLMKSSRAVNPFYDKMCLEGWLKSLRPQPHWKPSEYTLSLVKKVANGEMLTHMEQMAMETLYNDLQKLL